MKPNIDFKECLKDSPKFRESLETAEQDIDMLESKLDKLTKLCHSMVEAGKFFSNANSAFIVGLRDLAAHLKDDQLASGMQTVLNIEQLTMFNDALSRFTQVLTESQKYQGILLDQAHRSIVKSLSNFLKIDIRAIKETRKYFEKISNDLDLSLTKNSQVARSKPQEFQDVDNFLVATKSCFSHTSLDYVFQINVLHSKKKCEILSAVLGYMHAQNTFFHQGSDLFVDLEKYMKQVAVQLDELSINSDLERREMEKRHMLVQQTIAERSPKRGSRGYRGLISLPAYEIMSLPGGDGDDEKASQDVKMEGYLFKRTSNTFKTWVRNPTSVKQPSDRRWFQIVNNQLVYRKRSKDVVTVMEEDLRLCTVRPFIENDRRFCFEVVSPLRSHVLQADTDCDSTAWIQAIQAGVTKAYNQRQSIDTEEQLMGGSSNERTNSTTSDRQQKPNAVAGSTARRNHTTMKTKISKALVQTMLDIPGNNVCCDCATPNPSWASINLGITLCIECSGIHRSLGVHISKVRSITLDDWEQDLLKVMLGLGNETVNKIYEANVDAKVAERASPGCTRAVREAWIKAKYVQKSFTKHIAKLSSANESPSSGNPKARRWSVYKKKRKSPARTKPTKVIDLSADQSISSTDDPDDMSASVHSNNDVIVFGTDVGSDKNNISFDDSESESLSEGEPDEDVSSMTSLEDMARLTADMLLYKASRARNMGVMLEALALGANINWQNEEDGDRTPLIQAMHSGSMTAVEFLLLNGAKVDVRDRQGQSPLHHAAILGHTGQVCQLLKRHANQLAKDENGQDPLNIAIQNANADIVTLLRLAKLNDEMRDSEGFYGVQGDETVNDVFKDFTNLANTAPERLNRNK